MIQVLLKLLLPVLLYSVVLPRPHADRESCKNADIRSIVFLLQLFKVSRL